MPQASCSKMMCSNVTAQFHIVATVYAAASHCRYRLRQCLLQVGR